MLMKTAQGQPTRDRRGRLLTGWALLSVSALLVGACGTATPTSAPPTGQPATGAPGTTQPATPPPATPAPAGKTVLVIGTDISDTRTLDPQRQFDSSPYLSMKIAYDNLVTVNPDDLSTLVPQLAESWERAEDGGWVFHLKEGIKFASGNPFTADDVVFTFERLKNLKDTPSAYAENYASSEAIDPMTVKVNLVDPAIPWITLSLLSGTYGILDSKLVIENGGSSAADADQTDTATAYLDQHSAGTGPYQITSWERNQQIVFERNPNYWGPTPAFERVIVRGFSDPSAEVLALQNGDIDFGMNLSADQLASLEGAPGVSVQYVNSIDFMYWTLSKNHAESGALNNDAAREAVFSSIDYDGLIDGLLGGNAVRPAGFLPIGLGGQDEAYAEAHRYEEDLDRARQLLTDAGVPDGFEFDLSYGQYNFAGVPAEAVAQKLQSDLARVGITANLKPMDRTTFTTAFRAGETVSGITDWVADGPEPWTFAEAAVNRVAVRANWTPSEAIIQMMEDAASEPDPAAQAEKYRAWTEELVKQHAYSVLFQPKYGYAVSDSITDVHLTAVQWFVEVDDIKPAQ
jgi:peptide/nickel transport system substrate-binding protein